MTQRLHRPPARTAALLAGVTLSLTAVLTACGGGDATSTGSSSVAASQPFNNADVTFATDMIPHHAQALSMVDLTRGRPLPAPVRRLAQHILDAQGPEIQTMAGWLQDWHRPVPPTMRDHVNADHDGMGGMGQANGTSLGSDMPGMMTGREMQDLASASDADFADQWLRAMVRHHQGAVEMARTEQSSGEYAGATALARRIAAGQTREIAQMKAMLELSR